MLPVFILSNEIAKGIILITRGCVMSCYLTTNELIYDRMNTLYNIFSRAPADCRQYFTGVSGAVKSYNFAGGQMLASQQYTDCFRQELGKIISYFNINNNNKSCCVF